MGSLSPRAGIGGTPSASASGTWPVDVLIQNREDIDVTSPSSSKVVSAILATLRRLHRNKAQRTGFPHPTRIRFRFMDSSISIIHSKASLQLHVISEWI